MDEAVDGLDVEIIQSTSDEGSGLLRHVRESLGAHHSPDLFHAQQEATRGTAGALASRVRQADKDCEDKAKRAALLYEEWETYEANRRGPGRHRDYAKRIDEALAEHDDAVAAADAARQRQLQAREAIRGVARVYHPFDLVTGAVREASRVEQELDKQFEVLGEVASQASLSQRCRDRIAKAYRVVRQLVATIAFYHHTVAARVETLGLHDEAELLVRRNLIPGLYVQQVAGEAKGADKRAALREQAAALLAPLDEADSPLSALDDDGRATVKRVALDCAQLFQRSSSCVEGRNGQLALRHHSLHRLMPRKLKALTAAHNFFITRPDGTTAAERFFGAKPRKLFDALLNKLEVPRRPAAVRRNAA